MALSRLVTGGGKQARLQKAFRWLKKAGLKKALLTGETIGLQSYNPDFILLDEQGTIKVSQIRDLKKQLQLKPILLKQKLVLVFEAEKLTLPAQNALLKLLEEPPGQALIILTTSNLDLLLPTILSRCQITKLPPKKEGALGSEEYKKNVHLCQKILKASPGERLLMAQQAAKTKEKSIQTLEEQLKFLSLLLKQKLTGVENSGLARRIQFLQIIQMVKKNQKALRMLETQTNHRLIIENLWLSYPQING